MDGQFQTSFIPKRPIIQKVDSKSPHSSNFFMMIMVCVLVIVVILAGAVFGYQHFVTKKNDELKTKLADEVKKLDPKTLDEISNMDKRIETAKMLLKKHVNLPSIFDFLSKTTLVNVRFTSFTYAVTPDQKVSINMTGIAKGFTDVAVQAQKFSTPENAASIKNPAFVGLSLDKSGSVVFAFSADLDPSKFIYQKTITPVKTTENPSDAGVQFTNTTASSSAQSQ